MEILTRQIRRFLSRLMSLVMFAGGVAPARSTETKPVPSIPQRIAAIQKALREIPAETQTPQLLQIQWINWGNFNNWNNWANFANFANWNNWGNWANY